jgi:hypothetical protein
VQLDHARPSHLYVNQWLDADRFPFLTRWPSMLLQGTLEHTTQPVTPCPLEEWVTPQSVSAVLVRSAQPDEGRSVIRILCRSFLRHEPALVTNDQPGDRVCDFHMEAETPLGDIFKGVSAWGKQQR